MLKDMLEGDGGLILKRKKAKQNFVDGFTTSKGLMLDLDNATLGETKKIALKYYNRFKLEGYIILRSSQNNYHVVFNKYLSWRKTLEYLFKIVWYFHYHKHGIKPSLTSWAILQACKTSETLRISTKKHKRKPVVVALYGKTDKLIKDFLEYRSEVERV
jgi:hypothetical protein